MVYASSKEALKRALPGIAVEVQANDSDDIEWESLVNLLRELRDDLKDRYLDMPSRRDAVERLMETDVVRRLADGDEEGARELAHRVLDIGVPA